MDFTGFTFIGLMTLGFVNVVTFYKPDLDSKVKFAISLVFAFVLTFVPESLGLIIFDKLKLAISIALAASGGFKLATRAGGIK